MSERVALNADIVGYSRLLAENLQATTEAVTESRRLVEERLAENGGELVNFVGDNFMAVFETPMDALRSSIAITTDLEERNHDLPETQRLMFRMGIDQGEVEETGGQFFGDALNIAARIQAIAPPGGVSVSGRVYKALDEPELRFRPKGFQSLKNIPEEIDVYDFSDLPSPTPANQGQTLHLGSPTVAVLPFHISAQSDLEAAAELLRADLVHRLTTIPNLKIIDARSDEPTNPSHVARYMIESGIHAIGDDVRVYSKLLDVTSMNIVKSHKWDAPADKVLELSDRISADMANTVEVELIVGEPAGIYAELDDPKAFESIYLGWFHLTESTREGWARSIELFGSVAETHPDQAAGHVLLAFAWWAGAELGLADSREDVLANAEISAQRGMEIGDPTGLAQMVMAAVMLARGRAAEALELVDKVVVTRPTCDVTYGLEGSVRRYLGEWDKSVDLMDSAMRLTAMVKPWYPTVKACSLYLGGHNDRAASVAEVVLQDHPRNLEALLILAAAQHEQGLDRLARATAARARELFPAVDVGAWIDANPYQDADAVARWKESLRQVGLIEGD